MSFLRNAIVALAICALPALASAQGPAGAGQEGGPRRGGGMQPRVLHGIALSADQQAQVAKINAAAMEEMRALGPMQRGGPPPDSATRAKREELRKKQFAELRKILTADQQKTFDANIAEMEKRILGMRRNY